MEEQENSGEKGGRKTDWWRKKEGWCKGLLGKRRQRDKNTNEMKRYENGKTTHGKARTYAVRVNRRKVVFLKLATVDFIFFYRKLWTVACEKPMVKKVWKNMKNHVMVCPPPQNQNEVAKPSGSWQYPPPPLFEDFGGHFHVMCAQLRPVGTATSLGGVRRLPTRSAAPVSLDRPPLSPRLSARWTQCDDHLLRDHVRERCGQGERRRLMHLTRSGLAPG